MMSMELLPIDVLGIVLGHVELGCYSEEQGRGGTLIDMLACSDGEEDDGIPCTHLTGGEAKQAVTMRLVCKKWDQAIRRRFSHYARMTKYDCCR